ncbi:hypothetical protein EYF80_065563 [Liparis tanakae]|uniref:Uncharacterized protein n=1 Tax=Liparis tanakae TaxID=230148 RepID=A0A4Z2E6W1_9TELE|nr:hypothetical protein EYF80_065563 [Liparis tanakae]
MPIMLTEEKEKEKMGRDEGKRGRGEGKCAQRRTTTHIRADGEEEEEKGRRREEEGEMKEGEDREELEESESVCLWHSESLCERRNVSLDIVMFTPQAARRAARPEHLTDEEQGAADGAPPDGQEGGALRQVEGVTQWLLCWRENIQRKEERITQKDRRDEESSYFCGFPFFGGKILAGKHCSVQKKEGKVTGNEERLET